MTVLLTANEIRVEFGPVLAVDDLSFELSAGQLVGLVGPNGAGKTTLLRVLCGLHAPTRGSACIMGKPVLGQNEVVRQHVGFAPDTPPAYEELTVNKFLRFVAATYELSGQESAERIDFWLEQLWLTSKRDSLIKELSRGMRQRLTLARTFIPQPHVLLLDEPLAGLDPAGRIELRRVLGMLRDQGCAMIVSSHILTDLEDVSSHIAIIEQGRIIRWSTTDAMHHRDEQRRTYQMTTTSMPYGCESTLSTIDGITHLRRDGDRYTFDYQSGDEAAVGLLKRLIDADVPVASFESIKTSLEEVYLRSGVKQVD